MSDLKAVQLQEARDTDDVRLLTVDEVATRLRRSRRYAYRLIEQGHIRTVLLPATSAGQKRREMRVRLPDLKEFVDGLDAA